MALFRIWTMIPFDFLYVSFHEKLRVALCILRDIAGIEVEWFIYNHLAGLESLLFLQAKLAITRNGTCHENVSRNLCHKDDYLSVVISDHFVWFNPIVRLDFVDFRSDDSNPLAHWNSASFMPYCNFTSFHKTPRRTFASVQEQMSMSLVYGSFCKDVYL